MTYEQLLRRLYQARRFGVVLGLDRMRALLARLGDPQLETIVHVGGTNGKGSTVAMIAALIGSARVATYTSPHLSCLRERIVIGGRMIGEDAIVAAAERVSAAGGDAYTFFEQMTAIAAVAIADAGVDVTVLEVGLGGRLDATNAMTQRHGRAPAVAVVTGVAMDHEAILGDTLAKIAREKAGIFKRGQHVVIGASGEAAAVPILVDAAEAAGAATITVVDDAAIARVPPIALAGRHQRANAAAAIAAVEQLVALGVLPAAAAPGALATVSHPGRFEPIGDVIIDGAHNPHGAAALAATLAERGFAGDRAPVLVIAVSADKDVGGIARALAPHVRGVIATRYQQDRALAPEQLAAAFRDAGTRHVETAPDLASALHAARAGTSPSAVLVAGSLFLAGEARVLLAGAPADPFAVSDPSPGPSSAGP